MSASSPVALCNRALTLVGANTITSFLDDKLEARLCSTHYPQVRNAVTQAYNWSHSRARFGPMTAESTAPTFGFSYSYLLPADLIQLLWAGTDPNGIKQLDVYEVENNRLLADVGEGVNILYQRIIEDTTKFPTLFTEALVARLAAELALPLAESKALADQLFKLYAAKVDEAAAVDGMQGRNQPTNTTRHMKARFGHGTISGYLPRGFYSWGP